jgi:biotin operon repressor
MTTQQQRTHLEKKGYKVSSLMQGGYIAKKGQQTYKAETIAELYNILFN